MRKRLESVWAVGVEWLHFLYFAVTRGEKGNGNEGKRHQSDGRSRPEDFFFFSFFFVFYRSKGLLFILMMKQRYQRYGMQSYPADNGTYDTYLFPPQQNRDIADTQH